MEACATVLPNLVVCDPSPWDFDKALQNNISIDELSFITHLLYPQREDAGKVKDAKFQELDNSYKEIIKKFDNNPIYLLNNITKNCSQIIDFCQFGTFGKLNGTDCCSQLLSKSEYIQQYKCYHIGGMMNLLNFTIIEPSKAFGITVGVEFADFSSQLNENIASLWALSMTGIAVAVTNPKANLYNVGQNSLKLLAPNTCNIIGIERMEIDNSDKSSDFQFNEETENLILKIKVSISYKSLLADFYENACQC
jgi:hypothetical protein